MFNALETVLNEKFPNVSVVSTLVKTFKGFLPSSKQENDLEILVPKNIYTRTEMICLYIEDEVSKLGDYECSFTVANLIMFLYEEFLNESIKNYNPDKIRQEIDIPHNYDEKLRINANDKTYLYAKYSGKNIALGIEMSEREMAKGQLLLDELDDLQGGAPMLEKMLAALWINFIESYKKGQGNKILQDIIRREHLEFLQTRDYGTV